MPDTDAPYRANGWTIVGLLLALGGPFALASPPAQQLYALAGARAAGFGQLILCALVAGVLLVLRFGERLPLAAIGLRRPRARSVLVGLAIGVGVFAILLCAALALSQIGAFDNKEAGAVVLELSLPVRIAIAAAAGVIEEILYRGYGIGRITALTGSRTLAAVVTLAAFTLAHVPFWGWSAIATPLLGGAFFTALFLWRRDLIACIVAHSTIDLIGIVLLPALAASGR